MHILLPPSEGKAAPAAAGPPLDLATLSLPPLMKARERVLAALVKLCTRAPKKAQTVLGLSHGLRGEIDLNAALRTTATKPAADIYTGVLYDALGMKGLTPQARKRAEQSVLIFSGLWGVLRLSDRIPPYRCSISVSLPVIGGLAAYWRKAMTPTLADMAGDALVLDLRSTGYLPMWAPAGSTVAVRVLQDRGGKRAVVSHFNKATKGRLVRDLLQAGPLPKTPAALVVALKDLKYDVEHEGPAMAGKPWRVDVIVTEI